MKKVLMYVLLGIVVILTLVVLTKDFLIKTLVPPIASQVLGANVTLGDFSLDIGRSVMKVKDLRLASPQGFGDDPVVDIASLEVQYDLGMLLKQKFHFHLIDLDIRHIILVKNAEGVLNVQALKPLAKQEAHLTDQSSAQSQQQDIDLRIGTLKVNIDHFSMKDIRLTPPSVENVNIGFHHQTFKDIKSVSDLTMRVIVSQVNIRALTNTAFMATGKVKKGIGFLFDTTTGVVGGAGGLLKNIANKL